MVSRIGREIDLSPVELGSRVGGKVRINMASGTPDPRVIPIEEIKNAYEEVLQEKGPRSLFYPGAGGQPELIEEIRRFVPSLNLSLDKEDKIVVTSGAQHAIELISKYFLDNDVVAVENPTFVETFMAMKLRSNVTLPIDLDSEGMDVSSLERITKIVRPKLVYVIPNCHNPAGVNMSYERRKALVELASARDFYVVEDDPYRPIAGCVPPPIKSFDREGRVIYVSSFSKIIAPGLRVGFIVAKGEIAEKLSLLEQLDFSTSTINQYVVANLLRRGLVSKRMTTLAMHYSEKMKILTEALDDAGIFKFNPPKCGFFALVDLRTDAERVFEVATKDGLSFVKAKAFFLRGGDTMARLSVTIPTAEEIKEGVTILKRSVLDVKL